MDKEGEKTWQIWHKIPRPPSAKMGLSEDGLSKHIFWTEVHAALTLLKLGKDALAQTNSLCKKLSQAVTLHTLPTH